jgi:hypothetical protein
VVSSLFPWCVMTDAQNSRPKAQPNCR